jgi:hypothetical protein
MTFGDSIVVLEALLGSELLSIGVFPGDQPPDHAQRDVDKARSETYVITYRRRTSR